MIDLYTWKTPHGRKVSVMMLEADWQKVADRVIGWMRAGELDRI